MFNMVWPVLVVIVTIILIALYFHYKNQGKRGYPLNRYCLACQKRFPDNLSSCPECGEPYFSYNQK